MRFEKSGDKAEGRVRASRLSIRRPLMAGAVCAALWAVPADAQLIDLSPILNALLDLDTRVTANVADIVALEIGADATAALISDLDARVDLNTSDIATINAQLTVHANNIANNTADIDVLETRVTNNETNITNIDGRVTVAEADIDALEGRTTANETNITNLDNRVTNTEGDVAALDGRVTTAETDIATLDARVDVNSDAITQLDTRVTSNTATLATHSTAIANTNTEVSNIRNEVQILAQDMATVGIGLVRQADVTAPVTVAAQSGGTMVSFAGTGGDRRLTGIAAGVSANDAVNMAQMQQSAATTLASANGYTDSRLTQSNRALRRDMNARAANSAALAGLPQSMLPGKGMVGAAVGGHGSEVSFAMGLSKAFDAPNVPVIRAGAAVDTRRGDITYNASFGIHF